MTNETRELVAAQLVGLRATVGALQAQIVALETTVAQEPPSAGQERPGCQHPETENLGTFGAPEYHCTSCDAIVTPC